MVLCLYYIFARSPSPRACNSSDGPATQYTNFPIKKPSRETVRSLWNNYKTVIGLRSDDKHKQWSFALPFFKKSRYRIQEDTDTESIGTEAKFPAIYRCHMNEVPRGTPKCTGMYAVCRHHTSIWTRDVSPPPREICQLYFLGRQHFCVSKGTAKKAKEVGYLG